MSRFPPQHCRHPAPKALERPLPYYAPPMDLWCEDCGALGSTKEPTYWALPRAEREWHNVLSELAERDEWKARAHSTFAMRIVGACIISARENGDPDDDAIIERAVALSAKFIERVKP